MAQITINIPDSLLARVADSFALQYGYQETLPNGTANPETKLEFVKKCIMQNIRDVVVTHETRRSVDDLRTQIGEAVNRDIRMT